ncbi:MAG: protein kinase domain-containing protein [Bradymonadia bacterium]
MQEQFGRYILLDRIAIGGMAEIFRAKAQGLGGFEKILAIKRLHPRYSQDADFIEMLIDEAKITVELSHSNIGQIFDLGRHEDHYYIAMEYIEGRDLYRVMKKVRERRSPLPVEAAAYVGMECCAGLDYAHRKRDSKGRRLNIIHRDVSPQNVLLSLEGEVKLVDFGIAKAASRAYETEAGIIKGKFYYMSPEQAKGEALDHRTDIFSLGIVMYEMLTGDLLYKDDDDVTLLSRVRRADIEPPSRLRPDVPPMLEQIVMRALSKDREARYPTARHFQKDLANFLRTSAAVFGKVQLRRLMTELFEETDTNTEMPLDESVAMHRDDWVQDGGSVISMAGAPLSFEDDATEMQSNKHRMSSGFQDPGVESELFELDSGELELVEDEEETINHDGARRPEPFDSIDVSGFKARGGLVEDFFEEEETRAFDRPLKPTEALPDVSAPPAPSPRGQHGQRKPLGPPASLSTQMPVEFSATPTPEPQPSSRRRSTPVPGRSGQVRRPNFGEPQRSPAPAAEGQSGQNFNRRPTVIVAMEEEQKQAAPQAPPPRRSGRMRRPTDLRLEPVTPSQRSPEPQPSAPAARATTHRRGGGFFTRERVSFIALAALAAISTALLTRWIISDDDPEPTTATIGQNAEQNAGGGDGPSDPTQVGAVNSAEKAVLKIDSFPARGAQVKVDDMVMLGGTPTNVAVPPGKPIRVQVSLGDGYEAFEQTLTLKPGEERLLEARLVERQGTLVVRSEPIGAQVYVNEQALGTTPITQSGVSMKGVTRVRVSKPGFKPYERSVEWGGTREAQVVAVLEPLSADPPTLVNKTPTRRRASTQRRKPPRRTVSRRAVSNNRRDDRRDDRRGDFRRPPVQDVPPPPPRGGGEGFLSVQSQPWGTVFVDGRQVARETPMVKFKLSEGRYRVHVCYGGDKSNRSAVRLVEIAPGKHTRVSF